MMGYLVGIDGSAASASAMRWAVDLAGRNSARLLAVHAWDDADVAPTARPLAMELAQRLTEQWLNEVSAETHVQVVVRAGDPREVMRAVAETEQPDLVVLGRGGDRLGIGPEHLGRVAGFTARHTPWPLAVIPVGSRHRFPRVVIGVDGSAGAEAAVDWCARHLVPAGALVIAVDVDEAGAEPEAWPSDSDNRARIEAEINRGTAPLERVGAELERVTLLHQYPADALLRVADSRHADIIVIGQRGAGGFDGLQVGGTALKVLRRARVPLVLVPTPLDRRTEM